MIQKWRKSLDKSGAFGALPTDLSKAFNCLPYQLLITKIHAYGVDILSLKLLSPYLIKRIGTWTHIYNKNYHQKDNHLKKKQRSQ